MSNYQSIDEAVKWTVGLLEAIPEFLGKRFSTKFKRYRELTKKYPHFLTNENSVIKNRISAAESSIDSLEDMYPHREIEMFKKNLGNFANKLEARLEKEIIKNKILSSIRKSNKGVDLEKIVKETLGKTNLPTWGADFINFGSEVTVVHFKGNSMIDGYKSVNFYFGQRNKTSGTREITQNTR